MIYLKVGYGGGTAGTPTNNPFAPVNPTFLLVFFESSFNGFLIAGIHGELSTCPVNRKPEFFELVKNDISILLTPLPHSFKKFFAANLVSGQTFFGELFLHLVLGGDTGMIGAREPKSFIALHAPHSDDDIFKGIF